MTNWAAIISSGDAERFGAAEDATAIPMQQRRRLPPFTRDVLQCALPLLRERPDTSVVLSSPNGDLDSTVTLLTDIARQELMSPSLFGLSVHNAPLGALSLCLESPGDQVSLGGDGATFAAGLLEAYTQLATGEAAAVLLVHADARLPALYADLDETTPGVVLALSLTLADAAADDAITVGPGREGARSVVDGLIADGTQLSFAPPRREALAA